VPPLWLTGEESAYLWWGAEAERNPGLENVGQAITVDIDDRRALQVSENGAVLNEVWWPPYHVRHEPSAGSDLAAFILEGRGR
jgi:hypothetical protein